MLLIPEKCSKFEYKMSSFRPYSMFPMHKRQFILVIGLFFFLNSTAQQNNIWYFGKKAGLNFNIVANQPIPSKLTNSVMIADEGCASICDENGRLLFYSNGLTVYNRNHQPMLNGDGLAANISTMQGCIIVPLPGSDSLYYIFTTDAVENSFANGYRYSIIDMAGDNGNGGVTAKNILLWASCTERMTAIRHADGISVWLITNDNNSNIFRAWLINCSGLQTTPVVSTAGLVMDQHYFTNTGMMKASPDGKQICQTHFPVLDEMNHIPNFCQLFDFDIATGILSNPRSIGFPDAQIITCEYSPDSKLLYLARPYDKAIDQIECTLGNAAAITASRISISTDGAGFIGIQLAPDEKIYLCYPSWYLGVINRPNIKGAGCNFQKEQADVSFNLAYLGLPAFINDLSFNPNNGFNYSILDSCSGNVQFLGTSTMNGVLQWRWDFGDGTTSDIQNPVHLFIPSDQAYTVKLKVTSSLFCGEVKTSQIIKPKGIVASIDFDIINKCDSGYVRFINKTSFLQDTVGQLTWEFGDGSISNEINPIHTYTAGGVYNVKLKFKTTTPCLDDSLVRQLDLSTFTVSAPPDQTILVGQSVQLYVSGGGKYFQWTPGSWLSDSSSKNPVAMPLDDITYKVTAINNEGCKSEDSIFIKVLPLDDFYVPGAFTPNDDGKNDKIRPFYGGKFTLSEFSIFNRWGQHVFSTRERGAGWNGRVNNLIQDAGVYVWIIRATDQSGIHYERRGTFVLIR